MIKRLVQAALSMKLVVIAVAAVVVLAGVRSYQQLDIEAYPNPIPPMIEIITQPSGWSAEEVERQVTIPIENELNNVLDLDHIRSQSLFGLSDVKVYFTWDVDYYTAQQRVLNKLQFVDLPDGVKPGLSPWSAIGEIYRYRLTGKGYTLADLKTAQDWILEKQFRQVRGVIDVVSFGGHTKQYHVEVDPNRLRAQNLTLQQILSSIANANQNVGGQRLTLGEQSYNVRGIGLIRSLRDIGQIVVAAIKGTPVRIRDVAAVAVGYAPRLGIVGRDTDEDIVEGIVLMRYGGDSQKTIRAVHERVDYIREYHLLPPGMELEPFYDRANLVKVTTSTVMENVIVGMVLLTLVLYLFLSPSSKAPWGVLAALAVIVVAAGTGLLARGIEAATAHPVPAAIGGVLLLAGVVWLIVRSNSRAPLVTALNIPLALFVAFIGMVTTGTPANLISLGAVDFGIVVDSTVIMIENIVRHLAEDGGTTVPQRIAAAAGEVGTPMFFSTLIIGVAFIPLFTMTGVAGVIFSPMAHTYAFAIGGAIFMALTLTPVLASRALPKEAALHAHHDNWLMQKLGAVYRPAFRFAVDRPKVLIGIIAVPVLAALAASTLLGREFMPKLEEGNFWIRATLPTSIALEQSAKYVGRMRAILLGCDDKNPASCAPEARRHPEVETVVSQIGRPDDGTDVSGFYNIELFAPLKPSHAWRRGVTKAGLTDEISADLRAAFPGVTFNFSQVIADNVEEAMSGVKGENTVKVVGPDLRVNERKADEIMDVMAGIPGVEDLGMFRSLGQPDVRITPDRAQCGRYGLNVGDVEAVVEAAIGGRAVTQVYEGEKHFDLTVRWAPPFRKDLNAIRRILITTPDGAQVPLGQVAQIVEEEGPSLIYREDNRRYSPVKFSVRGRDLASTIGEAQARIKAKVKLPYDTHLEWAGEINQLKETSARLAIVIPLTLLLIAFLVYSSLKSLTNTLIVLAGIPVACSGGVLALFLTGTNFSISAAMGFISIFGIAIQDGLIDVTISQRLWDQGAALREGALQAAERRLRPALMTACVALIGLLPAAISRGIGSETQKPLAIVVIGGALALGVMSRILPPALLVWAHRRRNAALAVETQPEAPPDVAPDIDS